MNRIRLVAVATHPVQYFAPWFRHMAKYCPEIDLTVIYAVDPTPEQQGAGFDRAFSWDIPLTKGYQCRTLRRAKPTEDVRCTSFRGLDVPEIADAIREATPDVVLIFGWHSITLLRALFACCRLGIPVLYRGDTYTNSQTGWRRMLWEIRTWMILRLFSGYLCVGKHSREYLRHFGVAETKIFSSPHAVDNEFFCTKASEWRNGNRVVARRSLGLDPEDFVVLFAGKLDEKKRPVDAIHAVRQLGDGASLLIAGSGPLEERCRREAAANGVRVAWSGFLNQTEMGRAYAAADCLVLPSDSSETWGLVTNDG